MSAKFYDYPISNSRSTMVRFCFASRPAPHPLHLFIAQGQNESRRQPPMVNTIVDGTFRQTNLTNESSDYLAKREELRFAEIELMRHRERVAHLRRHLPQGAPIQDYQFEEGPRDLNAGDATLHPVRLSGLFTAPD